jgi:hypothetical protein
MRLVENIRDAWRWFSVQAFGAIIALPFVWPMLPAEVRVWIDETYIDRRLAELDADDSDGSARVSGSTPDGDDVTINARNDAAEIRASAGGGGTRTSWILTDSRTSVSGWRVVGYEARGPAGGPLVVATVRSRDRNRERAFEDAKDLVALNAGE